MIKAVILDGGTLGFDASAWDSLRRYADLTWYDKTSVDEVISRSEEAEVLLTNKVVLDKSIIARLPKLKYIGLLATGADNVDLAVAKDKGIVVCNVPAYSTASVAQHVFALLFNTTNQVSQHNASIKEGGWARSKHFSYWLDTIVELKDKVLGLIGFGHIAQSVAEIGLALGMRVWVYTPRPKSHSKVQFVSKAQLFSGSDVISLHCPLNEETQHIINESTLAKMKREAILINTGRGGLIDEKALARTLEANGLKFACLDVLTQEPPSPDNPLLALANCVMTPHIAWASKEARSRLKEQVIENVASFCRGEIINRVNP